MNIEKMIGYSFTRRSRKKAEVVSISKSRKPLPKLGPSKVLQFKGSSLQVRSILDKQHELNKSWLRFCYDSTYDSEFDKSLSYLKTYIDDIIDGIDAPLYVKSVLRINSFTILWTTREIIFLRKDRIRSEMAYKDFFVSKLVYKNVVLPKVVEIREFLFDIDDDAKRAIEDALEETF